MQTNTQAVEACRNLFGAHPEDIVSPIHCTSEALSQLEEILKTISAESLEPNNGYRIKRLADAAAYLAFEMSQYAECQYEAFAKRLKESGIVVTPA